MRSRVRGLASATVPLLLVGCALLSKAPPQEVRYFTPENVHGAASAAPVREGPRVRLGRVTASEGLRARIVYQSAPFELAEYEDRRWTENPGAYLRRALVRALFEERQLRQAVGGAGPTLDAELVVFEEVDRAAGRAGRVEIEYALHDERDVLAVGRVVVERPAASPAMESVVASIGAALDEAAGRIAEDVSARAR